MTLNVYVVSLAAVVFLFCFETHTAMGVGGLNLTEEAWSILKQSTRGEGKTKSTHAEARGGGGIPEGGETL